MDATDIIMLIVCVPLLIMMGVLCYVLLAIILKALEQEHDRK